MLTKSFEARQGTHPLEPLRALVFGPEGWRGDYMRSRNRIAIELLLVGILAWCVAALAVLVPFFFARKAGTAAVIALVLAGDLVAIAAVRAGRQVLGTWVMVADIWMSLAAVACFGRGWNSTTLNLFVALVLAAALLLDKRGAIAVAVASAVLVGGLVVAERTGVRLPHYFPEPPLGMYGVFLTALCLALLPVTSLVSSWRQALADTQMKAAELSDARQAVHEGERFYQAVYENAAVGIYRTTPDGRILAANKTLVDMLGFDSFLELATRNLNAGGFAVPGARQEFKQTIEREGEVRGLETVWIRRDGTPVVVREHARLERDQLGRPLYYQGTVEDITEQKRAQQALVSEKQLSEALFRSLPGIAYVFDENGSFLRWNDNYEKLLGWSRREMSQMVAMDAIAPQDRARAASKIREVFLRGKAETELNLLCKDGRTIPAYCTGVRSEICGKFYVAGIGIDISEKNRLQDQLLEAQKLESIGRLAGGVAHDFNNLLTVINGYSKLALGRLPENDPLRDSLEEIHSAGERAASLTRQLLAFGRRQVLEPRLLNLNAAILQARRLLERVLGERIDLRMELGAAADQVMVDPSQMDQVLLNLAVNARDAMVYGGRLTIATANVDVGESDAAPHTGARPGRYLRLSVSDTGVGMNEETRRRLFEPFFTTKRDSGGTGLGLATVYGVVEQSGGWITVESEPGKGSRFEIYLPGA